jgi:bifunctional non-homologous end joining protein LigD
MPDETVIDGEVVALDATGKPVFSLLQNGSADVHFYAFDVLMLGGRDVTGEPLVERRELLENRVLPNLSDPVRCSTVLEASLPDLIQSIREQGLEGLVAKRANSRYESGQRSGAWMKMRVNRSEEFIIGGYSIGGSSFDAVIVGHVVDGKLVYVARTRSGFTPALRAELLRRMKLLEVGECPFNNLPEIRPRRWGEGLTADKMQDCRWLRPELTARFEFLEWTEVDNGMELSYAYSGRSRLCCSNVAASYQPTGRRRSPSSRARNTISHSPARVGASLGILP